MRNTILTAFKFSLIGLLVSTGLVSVHAQTIIPASFAQPPGSVNTNAPGFKARVNQMSVARPGPDQNRIALAEQQLAGGFIDPNTSEPYPNDADLTLAGPDGFFVVTNVINWTQEIPSGTGVEIGLFQSTSTPPAPDEGIPGIPGVNGSTDNIAVEVLTFLQLKAGTNQFGVSSDDGFKVSIGANARDAFSTVVGFFDAGRGVAETLFNFVVAADGLYSARLLWFEGGGDANVEWYSVDSATDQRILINDRSNPNAIKAYRDGTVLSRPYVRSADPAPDTTFVTNAPTINIVIVDGTTASAQVQTNSIQLLFNDQQVTPTITKPAGTNLTTVSYKPPGVLGPDSRNNVRLIYGDNATPQILATNDYSFRVQPTAIVLFAMNGTNIWKYNRQDIDFGTAWREKVYDDSTWEQGVGPIGWNPDNTEVVPIQTVIMNASGQSGNFNEDGVHYTTLYVRGHFNVPGTNTAGARLLLTDMVDDGGVFYLNGAEIRRFGIGAGVTFDHQTFFAGHESSALDGPIEVSAASLVPGDNVFAAEVHQSDGTSSDIVFGAELAQIVTSVAPPTPKITSATLVSGSITIQWSGGGTLESAPSLTGPSWTSTGNSSGSFTEPATGPAKFYRVRR